MKQSNFLLGVLAGSITASVAVLLTTSQSGEQLRNNFKTKSCHLQSMAEDIKVKANELVGSIQHLTAEAKNNLPETIEEIKQSVMTWQQSTEPNKNNLTKEIDSIQRSIEQLEQQIAKQQNH
ncbi:YtxH domain-containing protein [Savagea sp. SN6]|uniref:YtxH domain-containing protein n=1 Tax=Savagea serpentis TaxID=2785297 RepID=A0A8J7KT68_9BACL|nr:YtxH domain-containing protein [Savagea serpentis]MBF4501249.1 YtxH domain-containing protein [Savagea serpentis]